MENQNESAGSFTHLQACAAEYIARHGIRAFMDEDFNLTGTRARAVVRDENLALAAALGLPVSSKELPVAIEKKEIWMAIDGSRRAASRAELARLFAETNHVPGLSFGQRLYLEWHYLAPNNYQFTLEKSFGGGDGRPAVARLLGWNMETELTGRDDFLFYTGLLGCTGLCAIAADGAVFMSHWDEVCNPKQFDGYARFAARHPGGEVHVIGAISRELATGLRQRHPELAISYHLKKIYYETTYTVRFARSAGKVELKFYEADVSDDYVPSCHNNQYGRWFPYGRFSQAYPGVDAEFQPCRFTTVP